MKEVVKLTKAGKFSITLSESVKPLFKQQLEWFVNGLYECLRDNKKVTTDNNAESIYYYAINEVLMRYQRSLPWRKGTIKLILTRVEAHVYWELCMTHFALPNNNPEIGNILMELHRRLS